MSHLFQQYLRHELCSFGSLSSHRIRGQWSDKRKQKLSLQNTAFCNCCSRRMSTRFNSLSTLSAGPRKRTLRFLTRASFTEAPANQKATAFRHVQVIFSSAHYILFRTCVFLSGSADLLYFEPKDSDINLTSHFSGIITWYHHSKITGKLHTFSLWM